MTASAYRSIQYFPALQLADWGNGSEGNTTVSNRIPQPSYASPMCRGNIKQVDGFVEVGEILSTCMQWSN